MILLMSLSSFQWEWNKPRDFLAYETTYTVEVGCRDLAGNELAGSTSFSFSTEADEVPPA